MFDISIWLRPRQRSVREIAVDTIYPALQDYRDWYVEHGLHLPEAYAHDPTAYIVDLTKATNAFGILWQEKRKQGELWEAKERGKEKEIAEVEQKIKEGLEIFGKLLPELTDESDLIFGDTH